MKIPKDHGINKQEIISFSSKFPRFSRETIKAEAKSKSSEERIYLVAEVRLKEWEATLRREEGN